MNRRISISLYLFTLGIISVNAQWTERDSLNLERILSGDQEIQLNPEAIDDIRLETPSFKMPELSQPLVPEQESIFNFDETLPTFFTDSIQEKRVLYLTLKPYTIFTKYNEDPVYGPNKNGYIWPMATKMYDSGQGTYRAGPASAGGSFNNVSAGFSYSFSMEDVLQRIFSKKGRARLRNAKNANAWKTY